MPVLFEHIFCNLPVPVIVCRNDHRKFPLYYVNTSARIFLNPAYCHDGQPVDSLLLFENQQVREALQQALLTIGALGGVKTRLMVANHQYCTVEIAVNRMELEGEAFVIIYLHPLEESRLVLSSGEYYSTISNLFHVANHTPDIQVAIQRILCLLGELVQASRVYLLERTGDTFSCTYEWHTDSISPLLPRMQGLSPSAFHLDPWADADDLLIAGDIRELPSSVYATLQSHDIKSIALLPVRMAGQTQGYIGFDDCVNHRNWHDNELQLLKNVSSLLSSLLTRRNAEMLSERNLSILQAILDNLDHAIYVNTFQHELVFINQAMADLIGLSVQEVVGKRCWEVLGQDRDGPCSFCPMESMVDRDNKILIPQYRWENQNMTNSRWYSLTDSVIQWVDGQGVHIQSSLDVTDQRNHEAQLRHIASIDTMTGVFNREWGYKLMQDMLEEAAVFPQSVSLVFLDLDGLKQTNDTYGHDAGDQMIKRIIQTIRSHIRKTDLVCRWGGDEFILLLRCDPDIAQKIMLKIQSELEQINDLKEYPWRLGFSYGIKHLTENPNASIDAVISQADKLMYEHKMSKRTGVNS